MTPSRNLRLQMVPMTFASALMVAPMMAFAQTSPAPVAPPAPAASRPAATPAIPDGAPGNPPSTVLGRAVDRATGSPTSADGTGSNPAGTALQRAATPPTAAVAPAVAPDTTEAPGSVLMARPRMSQIIGSSIYNERNEKIGEVEDILITPPPGMPMPRSTAPAAVAAAPVASATVQLVPDVAPAAMPTPSGPVAIIQVGGFLGMGGRLVTVPLADLRWNGANEHIVLSGATKESLQSRPAFEYAMLRPR